MPVLVTFVTLINPDWQLNPDKNPQLWEGLNRKFIAWYPFSWTQISLMTDEFNSALRQLAESENVPLFDLSTVYPKNQKYFLDDVHFTPEGNELFSQYLADYLIKEILNQNPN